MQQVVHADKLASLGEVVAGVAHEINNPNSFITYNLPMLEETWQIFDPMVVNFSRRHKEWRHDGLSIDDLRSDMVEMINEMKTGSDRINKVVNNLKDFARLDESSQTEPVDLNVVIDKAYTIVGAHARKYIGDIRLLLDDKLPVIRGHSHKLEQVIANLIVNAAYAVQEQDKEQGRLTLRTSYIKRLSCIAVEVEDNGIGIKSEIIDRIFDPFFTGRPQRGGTGLGLSVSYGLIKEHNGIIIVLSRPGLGTRFTLLLPQDRRRAKLDLESTILCIDQDPAFLAELKDFLTRDHTLPVLACKTPFEALSFCNDHPEIDLIISEIKHNEMNGWQLLEKIRERSAVIPVVLYSADQQALEQIKYPQTPDLLLQKPFAMEKILEIIQTTGRRII